MTLLSQVCIIVEVGKNMSEENCDHECEGCDEKNCPSRGKIEKLKPHQLSSFKHVIAVISGKGGVGKSMVTSLLAASLKKAGHSVAVMDADVTGPSIPQAFGLAGYQAVGDEDGIYPGKSKNGVVIMSANLLVDTPTTPIVWRGPMISSLVGQLYSNVIYGEMEYLLIDMPPGTGDVPLTVFQQIPVEGAIVVATPQDLVSMVVEKSVNMAKMMKVKLLGLVENMAYVECPHCHEKIDLFGTGDLSAVAKRYGMPLLDELPIDPALTKLVDQGKVDEYQGDALKGSVSLLEKL
jgi:Mrp family chromosome partitioning ATPase